MKNIKWGELHPNKLERALKFKIKDSRYHGKMSETESEFELLMAYQQWASWAENGKSVFFITHELVELLKKTDTNKVTKAMLMVPFNSFYIRLEKALDGFNGFYITNNSANEIDDLSFEVSFTRGGSLVDFAKFDFIFNDLHTVGDVVKQYRELDGTSIRPFKNFEWGAGKITPYKAVDLVINTILYLTSDKADIKKEYPADVPTGFIDRLKKAKNKTQKEVARRTISNAGYSIINLVGSSFEKSKNTSDETHTVATHWRRGHWRNQPYLNGDKKLIWIMPVIVNAKNGEPAKGHLYKA